MSTNTHVDSPSDVSELIRATIASFLPEVPRSAGESRHEIRFNHAVPVLFIPFAGGEPVVSETSFAVTKNWSSQGLALVLQEPPTGDEAIIGLWNDSDLAFLRGRVQYRRTIEAGFQQVGVELTEIVDASEYDSLKRLVGLAECFTSNDDDK